MGKAKRAAKLRETGQATAIEQKLQNIFNKTAIDFDAYCIFLNKIKGQAAIYVNVIGNVKKIPIDTKPILALSNYEKGEAFSQGKDGINIVVFDTLNDELVDSVCFDLIKGEVWRNRKVIATIPYIDINKQIKTIETITDSHKAGYKVSTAKFFDIAGNSVEEKIKFHQSIPKSVGLMRLWQLTIFWSMIAFDKVCKRLDIPYYLVGGLLIGAVRAGEFIPWDDDVDVAISPEGFEKLCIYCDSDEQFDDIPKFHMRARVKDLSVNKKFCCSVCVGSASLPRIEQFPWVYSDKGEECFKAFRRFKTEYALKGLDLGFKPNEYFTFEERQTFLKLVREFFDEANARFGGVQKSYHLAPLFFGGNRNATLTESMEPYSEVSVMGHNFPAPHDVDAYLTGFYGNYWSLPLNMTAKSHVNINEKRIRKCLDVVKLNDPEFYQKYMAEEWEKYNGKD